MNQPWLYAFENADKNDKGLLGGKGANLANMSQLGLPVPPGFTITTRACNAYSTGGEVPAGLLDQARAAIAELEVKIGKKFGGPGDPLLVSVRSGSKFSMPGMMDTILNLGLNDATCDTLAEKTGNPRFALDSYRRLIQTFGDVACGVDLKLFEHEFFALRGDRQDFELSPDELRALIASYKHIFTVNARFEFPQDVYAQLRIAIEAVFKSWNNPRAHSYRRQNQIADDLGTAVNVQAMVFGNKGDTSGTGVCFSRNPSNGDKGVFGEFLINAQGEDVVAGIRTPQNISQLQELMPEIGQELFALIDKLERHFRDMQDIEFTVEEGKLYILQTRSGKRTGVAAVSIAVDMVEDGLISKEEALLRVEPTHIEQLLHPQIDPTQAMPEALDTKGLPASPGAAVGRIVLDSEEAAKLYQEAQSGPASAFADAGRLILVREETAPRRYRRHGGGAGHGQTLYRELPQPAYRRGCRQGHHRRPGVPGR
jgi:pyruvate,orthophosphate dikinase